MKCYNCDKEITDGISICPYCHMKQRKNSTTKYIPEIRQSISDKPIGSNQQYDAIQTSQSRIGKSLEYQNANNGDRSRPVDPTSQMRPVRKSENGCNKGCKYSFAVIAVIFGIGIIITAIVAMIGVNASTYTSDRTLQSERTLATVPTLNIQTTTPQQTWNPVVTVIQRTTNVAQYVDSPSGSWTQGDVDFLGYSNAATNSITKLCFQISNRASVNDMIGVGEDGETLQITATVALHYINPLTVSPALRECKDNYVNYLKSSILIGSLYSKGKDAYLAGDINQANSLFSAGSKEAYNGAYWLKRSTETFPKELQ